MDRCFIGDPCQALFPLSQWGEASVGGGNCSHDFKRGTSVVDESTGFYSWRIGFLQLRIGFSSWRIDPMVGYK